MLDHPMPSDPALPPLLLRNLADAEVEVVAWSGGEGRLVLHITKDIGAESGLLTFVGVSHVHLPSRLAIAGLGCGGLELLPAGSIDVFRPGDRSLDADERVFVLHDSRGPVHDVVAESATYQVDANPDLA
jgi:hypothetical protein